ncbi:PREDICTED: equilibrative nucleoside transporter 1 [Trachymyrmex cornetzi]|uniref:Equilibrative nucleoside transporter 1 n=1 Tax=Trachymyrmex cornetzi TaxID=471704 RepID=A0A151IXJ0_9HYME|nr:PREDICTED: equilibrative nucleoside transporter 1 [Trachymyrmex cornetzi]XP_018372362.1 PREDICTED: equilibrative nucleoside transporter 1 [Trachymyrmex cornetzi]KYN12744.1 Equilibrative nucleoside transporter 1 [Trachymyrmex cornetzi]
MAYSINRRPLLGGATDSEFEDDVETEVDDPSITIPDEKPFFKPYEPHDKYNLAYIVFYLLGINTLIPWSFFITADDYWMYKFREIHNNSTNLTHTYAELLEQKTDLQASFTSYLSVASALPNTLFLILNAFISKKVSLTVRMVGSQCAILLLFILTTAFVEIKTDKWQNAFLIITLTTVALVNAASAIFGGSLMGIVGKFSPKYITAMSGGQALGGIFTALAEVCSLWIGASPVLSGLVYFIIGDTMLLLSLIAYILLEKAPFFKHHMIEKVPELDSDYSINGEVSFSTSPSVSYARIIKRIWHYGVSIFLIFFISLAVYPAVTVLVESEYKGKGHAWNDIYFVPVVTYLIFSTGDYAGRVLCGILQWPRGKPWLVIFLSVARGIFIPAFMFCNAQPRHHLPVYIHSDIYYILITIAFAVTNGYLCNLTFILAPTVVDSQEKEVASAMMGAFLGIGLASGAALSLYMVKAL